jgi:chromosome segregation ATPase
MRDNLENSERQLYAARTDLDEAEEQYDDRIINNLREVRAEYADRFRDTLRRIENFERQAREADAEREQTAETDNLLLQANQRIEELENDTTIEDELLDQINEDNIAYAKFEDELEVALAHIASLQAELDAANANAQAPRGTDHPQRSDEDIAAINMLQTQLAQINATVAELQQENANIQTQINKPRPQSSRCRNREIAEPTREAQG